MRLFDEIQVEFEDLSQERKKSLIVCQEDAQRLSEGVDLTIQRLSDLEQFISQTQRFLIRKKEQREHSDEKYSGASIRSNEEKMREID